MFKPTNQFQQYVVGELSHIKEMVNQTIAINLKQNSSLKEHEQRINENEKEIAKMGIKLGFLVFFATIIINLILKYIQL